jgi:hypothetical protein
MGEVRNGDADCVEMRVVLLEEFPEIGEPAGLGITRNYLLRFFLPKPVSGFKASTGPCVTL